jgi:hypothetical protein
MLWVRQRFVAAPPPKVEERLIGYAGVSIVYLAVVNPIAEMAGVKAADQHPVTSLVLNGLEYIIVPALLGVLAGFAAQKDWSDRFWALFHISLVHHAPTAWDFSFTRLKTAPFVIVTLKDGSRVAGNYCRGSFASSNNKERDLLIAELYDCDKQPWEPVHPLRSVLLCGQDIRFVEFFTEPKNGETALPTTPAAESGESSPETDESDPDATSDDASIAA